MHKVKCMPASHLIPGTCRIVKNAEVEGAEEKIQTKQRMITHKSRTGWKQNTGMKESVYLHRFPAGGRARVCCCASALHDSSAQQKHTAAFKSHAEGVILLQPPLQTPQACPAAQRCRGRREREGEEEEKEKEKFLDVVFTVTQPSTFYYVIYCYVSEWSLDFKFYMSGTRALCTDFSFISFYHL